MKDFIYLQKKSMADTTVHLTSILSEFSKIKSVCLDNFKKNIESSLQSYDGIKLKIKEENRKNSYLFNPLRDFFYIGETTHSMMLGFLLNPNETHGQGNAFLKLFLEKIGVVVYENDHWIVTAEIGRIDILLRRKHPHSVIIIENKSNNAGDQENQLYRYWLQEMFSKIHTMPKEEIYNYTLKQNRSLFQIIYLSPNEFKKPHPLSLKKPDWDWLNHETLPENLDEQDIKILYFKKEITEWLNECLAFVDIENARLKEFINQYIEVINNL